MFNPSLQLLKKGWTYNPGRMNRGGKNTIWRPKMNERQLRPFLFLNFEHPRRRPESWDRYEFRRLGMVEWPKEVGFFNAGDNFELTPEMSWRLFQRNKNFTAEAAARAATSSSSTATDDGGEKKKEDMNNRSSSSSSSSNKEDIQVFWTRDDNERTIIDLLPIVEKDPAANIARVEEVFRSHVENFGVDHIIYNAVLQAVAFARDLPRCKEIFAEMKQQGLEPNAQTYVNMMLAVRLSSSQKEGGADEPKTRAAAAEYFTDGVAAGALKAVMRLDTEFSMWWDQLQRMGSFTEGAGFLSCAEEGARSRPKDVWALWGWDSRHERKFIPLREAIGAEASKQNTRSSNGLGTVFNSYRREPWHRYTGMMRPDFVGPPLSPIRKPFKASPAPTRNNESCGTSY